MIIDTTIETFKFLSLFCDSEEEIINFSVYKDDSGQKYPKHFSFPLKVLNKPISDWKGVFTRKSDGKELPYYFNTNNKKNKEAVFFVVNAGGTKKDQISKVRAFFIDCDFAKEKVNCSSEEEARKLAFELEATDLYQKVLVDCSKSNVWFVESLKTKTAINKLKSNFLSKYKTELKDSLIVETYSGFHIYWLVSDCAVEIFEKIEAALVLKFDSDPAVKNLARILRVPGFLHQKYDEPFLVSVIQWTTRKFKVSEFLKELNLSLEKEKQNRGYVKSEEQEKVSFNSELTRSITKVEHSGRNATISFNDPVRPINSVTFAEALEEVLRRPLTDFVKKPVMIPGEMIQCPFHDDSNPSAHIFRTKKGQQALYCHACTVDTRNVVGMYMLKTGKRYVDSVKKLASMIGFKVVKTEWELGMLEVYNSNRHFLEDDIETYYPNLYKFISKYGRIGFLRHFNDKGEVKILKEGLSYKGHNVFFTSIRYIMTELQKKSVKTVHNTVLLLCLLGFIERVPNKSVPEEMKIRSAIETKGLKQELAAQGEVGQKRAEAVRDINFYIIKSWNDEAYNIESIATELLEKGFSLTNHMNKTGLTKLMGEGIANRVFPDERKVTRKFETMESKFIEIVDNEINEKGFCVVEELLSRRIRYEKVEQVWDERTRTKIEQKRIVKATKAEKEDVFKRSLNNILGDSYKVIKVRNVEKRKMFGYYKNSVKEIKVIIPL